MELPARGAIPFNEPGVYMAFEENAEGVIKNFSSPGYGLDRSARGKNSS